VTISINAKRHTAGAKCTGRPSYDMFTSSRDRFGVAFADVEPFVSRYYI
jgi:hypothetical protein